MDTRWVERDAGSGFAIEVNGIDAAKKEAAELERFARMARLPNEEGKPSTSIVDLTLVVGAAFFAWCALGAVASVAGPAFRSPYLVVGTFFAAFFVPLLAVAALRIRAKRSPRSLATPFQERFTFAFADGVFSFRGQKRDEVRLPVVDVVAFEARRRGLTMVTSDGTRVELPCDLGAETTHRDLAARLGEQLARARAETQGYRGGVRIAEDAEAEADAESADAERQTSGS